MTVRYFIESPLHQADTAQITGPELHHLAHVMRAKVGDQVVLFDGTGFEYQAEIAQLKRNHAVLQVVSRQEISRELPFELTLAVALPKGDRQRWLVEKATELGVTRLVPLVTRRGVAQPYDAALARLERAVIEAAKQCERNQLMQIDEPQEFLSWSGSISTEVHRLLAHPKSAVSSDLAAQYPLGVDSPSAGAQAHPVAIAVGPEGGFAPEEVQAALAAGWQPVDLGKAILRVETAALALVARVTAS